MHPCPDCDQVYETYDELDAHASNTGHYTPRPIPESKVATLRHLLHPPGWEATLAEVRAQIADAIERDRQGLPPVSTGNQFRDDCIAAILRQHKENK